MKKNLIKFTETDYPNGYSRNDCQRQLADTLTRIKNLEKNLKSEKSLVKELQTQLKQGGHYEI